MTTSPAPTTEAALMWVRMLIEFNFETNQQGADGRLHHEAACQCTEAGQVPQECSHASPSANAAVILLKHERFRAGEAAPHPSSGLGSGLPPRNPRIPRRCCCPTLKKHQEVN